MILTPGNIADCTVAPECVRHLAETLKRLLGDKAYDFTAFREELDQQGISAVIPSRSNRRSPSLTTRRLTKVATSSNAALAG